MAKPKRDPVREERIHEEIIVDAYGPEEQAMGWYYYLEDKIHFPFQAKCITSKVISPLQKGVIRTPAGHWSMSLKQMAHFGDKRKTAAVNYRKYIWIFGARERGV